MGFYVTQVVPRLIDLACGSPVARPSRQRVCAGLHGQVLEIGFGSGLNVAYYPPAVTAVDAVEPADVGWRLAASRVACGAVPVRRSGLDGQCLPFPDATFDSALSTWTLCTIPDVAAALQELRRVLKPGPPCTSWSTAWPPTGTSSAGSAGSNRFREGSPAAATSPGRSPSCSPQPASNSPSSMSSTNRTPRSFSPPSPWAPPSPPDRAYRPPDRVCRLRVAAGPPAASATALANVTRWDAYH